ncbi:GHKL domain-containing protein [Alloscardovia theropitheci]|uniref:GHKL domain-containing protein n=1 Tax=Alloscardovia theropitheci TaxID=2496842 RepID=A0A4R0QSE2_9BIFI|nr:GHKL domain-containing protein [Alloscardovia theropitheci]TCD54045.1 GHKL domain-containing protein [Alloscardovia theropitheci]
MWILGLDYTVIPDSRMGASEYAFFLFPLEVLFAMLIVARCNPRRVNRKSRIGAVAIFAALVAIYVAVLIGVAKLVFLPGLFEILFFPVMSLLYLLFASSFVFFVHRLYDVSYSEAIVITSMGYGLQHLAYTLSASVTVLLTNGQLISDNGVAMLIARECVVVATYVAAYIWLSPRFHIHIDAIKQSKRWIALSIIVLIFAIVFNMVLTTENRVTVLPLSVDITFRLLDFLCTLLGMVVLLLVSTQDRLINEIDMLMHLNEAKMQHYDMSLENMELVNAKFHDVRKSLASVRATILQLEESQELAKALNIPPESVASMRDLENAIKVYDSIYHTGNELIDAVLTEKSLYCSSRGIAFNAIVDGKSFGFLSPSQVAAIFGNIIDNAIEAVENAKLDQSQRVIELNAQARNGYAVVESSNYYVDKITILQATGLPVSTKTDKRFHGYGMKSLAAVTQEYGGKISVSDDNDKHIFEIRIVLPIPAGFAHDNQEDNN